MTIYQVDYSATSSGKIVSMTKRRLRWRWGIANEEAMEAGKVGVECRGYEHEISLVWSIASGKKLVIDDGKEVHYSAGRREGKFQQSWTGWNNHVFTIVAHASPPISAKPGFRQFELFIDGLSFNTFPRIFELTNDKAIGRDSRVPARMPRSSDHRSDRETLRSSSDEEMKWAERVHHLESKRMIDTTTVKGSSIEMEPQDSSVSLLDMEYSSSPSLESTTCWDSYNSSSSSDQFDYAPSQPPSYEAVWSSIMDSYDTVTDQQDIAMQTTHSHMPDMSKLQIETSISNDVSKGKESFAKSPRDVADMNQVFKNLVNLDDISSSVMQGYTQEKCKSNQQKNSSTRSLSELKSMQNHSAAPKKEIMKTHQVYAQTNPGAMVIYGQQNEQHCNSHAYSAPPFYGSGYYGQN